MVADLVWEMEWLFFGISFGSPPKNDMLGRVKRIIRGETVVDGYQLCSEWVFRHFERDDYRLVREMEPRPPASVWPSLERCYRIYLSSRFQRCGAINQGFEDNETAEGFWAAVDESHPAGPETEDHSLSRLAKSLFRLENPSLSLEAIRSVLQRHYRLTREVLDFET